MIQHASNLLLSSNVKTPDTPGYRNNETGQISKHIFNQGQDDTCRITNQGLFIFSIGDWWWSRLGITNQGLFHMSSRQTEMTIRIPRLPVTTIEHLGASGISWGVNHQFQGIQYINLVESTCTLDSTSSNIESTLTWQRRSTFSPRLRTQTAHIFSSPRDYLEFSVQAVTLPPRGVSRNIPPRWL
jgi:hypothetical protein